MAEPQPLAASTRRPRGPHHNSVAPRTRRTAEILKELNSIREVAFFQPGEDNQHSASVALSKLSSLQAKMMDILDPSSAKISASPVLLALGLIL